MKRKIIDLCILTFVIYMTLCCLLGGGFFLPKPGWLNDKKETFSIEDSNQMFGIELDESGILKTTTDDSQIYFFFEQPKYVNSITIKFDNLQKRYNGELYYLTNEGVWCEENMVRFFYEGRSTTVNLNSEACIFAVRVDVATDAGEKVFSLNSVSVEPKILVVKWSVLITVIIIAGALVCFLKFDKAWNSIKVAGEIIGHAIVILVGVWSIENQVRSTFFQLSNIYIVDYILLGLILYILFFAISNSTKFADIAYIILCGTYGTVNAIVYNIRGIPVQPQDLASANAALNVSGAYSLTLDKNMKVSLVVLALFLIVCIVQKNRYIPKKKVRICFGIGYAIVLTVVSIFFIYNDKISTKMKLYVNTWRPKDAYEEQGTLVAFLAEAKNLKINKPEGYSVTLIEEKLSMYLENESNKNREYPNIIVIMNESFSDLSVINDFKTNEDYMPYWRNLKENTIKGTLYVSAWGGYTADTEFEFLTGNSTAFLPNIGYSYVTDYTNSIVSELQQQGYETYGNHPYYSSGYRRSVVYKFLEFENVRFFDEYNLQNKDFFRNDYAKDDVVYDKIIEDFENSRGKPIFSFNVTMQNHGPWGDNLEDINVEEIDGVPQTNCYLSCIKESDAAFNRFIKYFEGKEPTIILMFGDHQPAIEPEFYDYLYGKTTEKLTLEELQKKYAVPFALWANYDIEEADQIEISSNYLSSFLMDIAGVKMTAYNQYLLDLYEQIPVITKNGYKASNGVNYMYGEYSEYQQLLDEYWAIEYYYLFDKKKNDIYFELQIE